MIIKHNFHLFLLMSAFLAIVMHMPLTCSSPALRPTDVGLPLSSPSNTWPSNWDNAIFESVPHSRRWRRGSGSKGRPESLRSRLVNSKSGREVAKLVQQKGNDQSGVQPENKSFRSRSGRFLARLLSKKKEDDDPEKNTKQSYFRKSLRRVNSGLMRAQNLPTNTVKEEIYNEQFRLALAMAMAKNPKQLKKKKELLKMAIYIEHALEIAKKLSDSKFADLEKAKERLKSKEEEENAAEREAIAKIKQEIQVRRQQSMTAPDITKPNGKGEKGKEPKTKGKTKDKTKDTPKDKTKDNQEKAKQRAIKQEEKARKDEEAAYLKRQKQEAKNTKYINLAPARSEVTNKESEYNELEKLKNQIKRFYDKILELESEDKMISFGNRIFNSHIRTENRMKNELLNWEKEKIESINEEDIDKWTQNHLKKHPMYKHAEKLEILPKTTNMEEGNKKKNKKGRRINQTDMEEINAIDRDQIRDIRAFLRVDVVLDWEARIQCLRAVFLKPLPNLQQLADDNYLKEDEIFKYFINPLEGFHGLQINVEHKELPELPLYEDYFRKKKDTEVNEKMEECKNNLLLETGPIQNLLDCIKSAIFIKISKEALRKSIEKNKQNVAATAQKVQDIQPRQRTRDKLKAFFRRKGRATSPNVSEEGDSEELQDKKEKEQKLILCASKIDFEKAKDKLKKDKKSLKNSKSLSKKFGSLFKSKSILRSLKGWTNGQAEESFTDTLRERLKDMKETNKHFMDKLKKEIIPFVNGRDYSYETVTDALNYYLEVFARLEFAKGPGKNFLATMVELSKSMTMAEVQKCNEHFTKTISGFNAEENDETIDANGEGAEFGEYDDVQQHKDGGGQPPLTHGDANKPSAASSSGYGGVEGGGEEPRLDDEHDRAGEEEEESGLDNDDDGYGGGGRRKGPADDEDDDGEKADKHQQQRHTDDSDVEQGDNDQRHGKHNDDDDEEEEVPNDDEEEEENISD